ncbi:MULTISPECIES: MarR family winged helix-turn-helix transcriptional regulator [unclassified Pseudonocardia]|uniref:MarR family winged helix-turn-helix transcriptional regulator n=1 Tax=unclassified Pseudonocardia TaxID=2619320 RepID=UPI001CF67E4E|nr:MULTISPECIES: MarR family winged helix-turn-helix transcriptional regulator [unclassified Pseudonocardia]
MPEPDFPSDLVDAFWAVARRLRHTSAERLADWGLSPSQARALMVLARHGEMRPGELAGHLRIAPRSATEVVDALAGLGMVERAADPGDRRAVLLRLTGDGAATAGAIRAGRADEAQQFFGRLGDHDRAELARILGTLRDEVHRDAHRGPGCDAPAAP